MSLNNITISNSKTIKCKDIKSPSSNLLLGTMNIKLLNNLSQKLGTLHIRQLPLHINRQYTLQQINLCLGKFNLAWFLNSLNKIMQFDPAKLLIIILVTDLANIDLKFTHLGINETRWKCFYLILNNMGMYLPIWNRFIPVFIC